MDRRTFLITSAAMLSATVAAQASEPLKLRELYNPDQSFSKLAQSLEGERVSVSGFMAPPLKAQSNFFILTKMPMSVCPFCETEAEWPPNILAVYTKRIAKTVPFNVKIKATGILELGGFKDPDTGFVSRVRLSDAVYH